MSAPSRVILHVDMDAFYASVEQRDDPALQGRPVIVGGTSARGVVAAASYEVRRFGVHSAMPMREALRRCPEAICLRPRMAHYQDVSRQIFEVFHEFTPLVQGLSLDEAFLDVTASLSALGPAARLASKVKARIRERTQLTASVGVAPNKLVAKIASDLHKPDGLVVVKADRIHEVLDPLSIRRLLGIGSRTAPRVETLGICTLGELRVASVDRLRPIFGRYAERIRERAAGIDDRPVVPDWEEKSIGAEETFAVDIVDPAQLHAELARLADRSTARLRSKELLASCAAIKVRRADFTTFTRQCRLAPPTQETRVIAAAVSALLSTWLREQPGAAIRLLGCSLRELTPAMQLDLFAAPETERDRSLDATVDRIRERFGTLALTRASSLRHNRAGGDPPEVENEPD